MNRYADLNLKRNIKKYWWVQFVKMALKVFFFVLVDDEDRWPIRWKNLVRKLLFGGLVLLSSMKISLPRFLVMPKKEINYVTLSFIDFCSRAQKNQTMIRAEIQATDRIFPFVYRVFNNKIIIDMMSKNLFVYWDDPNKTSRWRLVHTFSTFFISNFS